MGRNPHQANLSDVIDVCRIRKVNKRPCCNCKYYGEICGKIKDKNGGKEPWHLVD